MAETPPQPIVGTPDRPGGTRVARAALTVLIVDDDPGVRRLTERNLQQAGFHVLAGGSAAEAIELAYRHHPALVLLDVVLPDGSGVDVARQLKGDPALVDVFVVLFSGERISAVDQAEGLDGGFADGYMVRPIGKLELLARIDAFLRIRETQRKLRDSERTYRLLVENSHDIIYTLSTDGVFTFVSPAWTTLVGHATDQVVGRPFQRFVHPDDLARCEAFLQAVTEKGGSQAGIEYRVRHADGSWRWHSSNGAPVMDETGTVVGYDGIAADITDRRRAEDALRLSEEKFAAAFRSSPDANLVSRLEDGRIVEVNDGFVTLSGYAREEALGSSTIALGLWADLADRARCIAALERDGTVNGLDFAFRNKAGEVLECAYSGAMILVGGEAHVLSQVRDVGERRRAVAALGKSEALLRGILDNVQDAYLRADRDGRLVMVSPSAARMFGYGSEADMIGLPAVSFYADEPDREAMFAKLREQGSVTDFYCSGRRKDGSTFAASINAQPYRDDDGAVLGTDGFVRDITERDRVAMALGESEQRYRSVVTALSEAIVLQGADGTIEAANASAEAMLGLTLDQMARRTPIDPRWRAVHEDGSPFPGEKHPAMTTLATGEPCSDVIMGIHKPDGTLTWISTDSVPLFHAGEQRPYAVVTSSTDITDLRRAAGEVEKSQAEHRESERRLLAILEGIALVGVILDSDGRVTFCNDFLLDHTDWTRDEVLGRNWFDLFLPPDVREPVRGIFLESIATGEIPSHYENEIVTRSGGRRLVAWNNTVLRDATGHAVSVASIGEDVTDARRAEDELLSSRERYRALVENISDVIFTLDLQGTFTYVSPAIERLAGYTTDEVEDTPFSRFVHPDDRVGLAGAFAKTAAGISAAHEFRVLDKTGAVRWVVVRSSPVSGRGIPPGITGVMSDITERKQAEEAERASEARYRLLAEHTTDLVWLTDMNMRVTYQSPSSERLRGFTAQELSDLPLEGNLAPESLRVVLDLLGAELPRIMADPDYDPVITLELEYYRKDGTTVWSESRFSVVRDDESRPVAILGEGRDITERRQAELALAGREAELTAIFDVLPIGLTVVDREHRIVRSNPALGRELHLGTEEIAARGFRERRFIRPDGTTMPPEEFASSRAIDTGATVTDVEIGVLLEDGSTVWTSVSAAPVGGPGTGAVVVTRDVTERKLAEDELARRGAELAEAQRIAHVGSWTWDPAADAVTWSEETFRIFGVEPDGPAPTFAEQARFYTAETAARINWAAARSLETGQPFEVEGDLVRADGTTRRLLARAEVVRDADGVVTALRGTAADITELHETQALLLQAQKMETVGHLAGGIAHDFNNLIAVIAGNAELVRAELPPGDPQQVALGEIEDAAHRGRVLTRQLLAFSRQQAIVPEELELDAVVGEIAPMLRRLIGAGIELRSEPHDPGSSVGRVRADRAGLGQVLMNLAVNARDAMPGGGTLTITTREEVFGDADAGRPAALAPGRYEALSVTDTGSGMDAATQERIFEPFFTTKGPDGGTGLGLPTVLRIAHQSGGTITIESEPGHGSTFTLYLPAVGEVVPAPRSVRDPGPAASGTTTILVVEDDPGVRRLTERILSGAGYAVLVAPDGTAALEALATYPGRVGLVVTDVSMPMMGGEELARRIAAAHPGTRVLLMSGYPGSVATTDGIVPPGTHLLGKPFTAAELTAKVREVLGA